MTLSPEWKRIVKKAWSFKLVILGSALSAIEVLLPYWDQSFPRGIFAMLTVLVTVAAGVMRIVAQRGYDD